MKISNRLSLPQAIVDAVSADEYSRGAADISVTGLLSPPRMTALLELHRDEIVEDAADRIWSLLGQSVHTILERANRLDLAEQRHFLSIGGWTISGKFDTLTLDDSRILSDYKLTSVYKVKDGEVPSEFEAQLQILAELLIANGIEVKSGRVICLLRDWRKAEARRDPAYPQSQVVPFDVPLWPRPDRIDFIERRVALHQAARLNLPLCSDGERWMKPAKWAVMKDGRTRAIKLFDFETHAQEWIDGQRDKDKMYVEYRPTEPVRCADYCPVGGTTGICRQYAEFRADVRPRVTTVADDDVL
jgi:hypothetical protein